MVLQDKYKRANSSRYRATHGGIQSNRQKAKAAANLLHTTSSSNITQQKPAEDFPELIHPSSATAPSDQLQPSQTHESLLEHPPSTPPTTTPDHTFSRRQLASNAHRYLEPEQDPNEEPEPEIDLTDFVEKHKTKIAAEELRNKEPDEQEDVDESFDHLFKHSTRPGQDHHTLSSSGIHGYSSSSNRSTAKPTKVFIEDSSTLGLDELDNERKKADATRELIARFSAQQLAPKPSDPRARNNRPLLRQKPTLNPSSSNSEGLVHPLNDEDFLDEVLNDSSGTYGKFKRT